MLNRFIEYKKQQEQEVIEFSMFLIQRLIHGPMILSDTPMVTKHQNCINAITKGYQNVLVKIHEPDYESVNVATQKVKEMLQEVTQC